MRTVWVCGRCEKTRNIEADIWHSVLSVKGNKVLHIDRNDHYGGFAPQSRVIPPSNDV